jgi:hypothetical protein
MIYSWVTQSGFLGFLTAMEMEAIGFALPWLTFCIGALLFVIPLGAIGAAVEKLAPAIGSFEGAPQLPTSHGPFPVKWK